MANDREGVSTAAEINGADALWIGWIAHINHLETGRTTGQICVVARDRYAVSIRVAVVIRSGLLWISRIAHVNDEKPTRDIFQVVRCRPDANACQVGVL